MRELLAQYVGYLQEQEKSKATIAKYTHDIGVFLRWIEQRRADVAFVEKIKHRGDADYAGQSLECSCFGTIYSVKKP